MRRREFITLLAAATVIRPPAAYAQQPTRSRLVGVLLGFAESDRDAQSGLALFREELRKLGWTEGRNIEMEIHAAGGDAESIKRFAKELVALQPDLIVTSSTPATAAVLQQTRTIPVIFVEVGDPIGSGFVTSLAQPGGNVTGFTPIVGSLGGKWVEVLRDIAPRVSRVTLVFNPPTAPFVKDYLNPFRTAAASHGVEAIVGPVKDMSELEALFTTQAREPNSGFIVIPDVFTISHGAEIIGLAARWRVPTIYWGNRRPDLLRPQYSRRVPACGVVCRPRAQGRETK